MLFIGVILTLHLSMNAQVGAIIKNPKIGNALFWTIGAFTAILIALTSLETEAFSRLKEVPAWLLLAGVIGAILVFGIAWTIPQIGAASAFVLMIAGQVIAGVVLSHFGLLGSPIEKISILKIMGILLLLSGVSLVSFAK